VLTAVGLLPIAAAGIDIRDIMRGARDGMKAWRSQDPMENDCYRYAVMQYSFA
jgi:glucose-6-phosphate isomerase